MKPFASLLTLLTCCVLIGTANVSAQCAGQDVPDCTCEQLTAKSLTICVGGSNHTITLFSCEQTPNPNPISHPCFYPNCTMPTQSRVSWIKQICLPFGFPVISNEQLYNAIICATDLCVNDYLGVSASFPTCNPFTPPKPACGPTDRYCHTIALPKCVERDGNCINICDEDCDQFCYVERMYCKYASACYTCEQSICTDPDSEECPGNCTTVDCDELSFDACCP